MVNKLYPPIIEGTIPAFYGDEIIVPYSMNKVVNKNEIAGFSLKIKTVQNNYHLGTVTSFIIDENKAKFILNQEIKDRLNKGQYYKIQLAYVKKVGEEIMVGHYSTVGVVKYTSEPKVYIDGLDSRIRNLHNYEYVGIYEQEEDWTEKVYSYSFKVWDINNGVIADSGELLHDSSTDDAPNKSFDKFSLLKELTKNTTYYICYKITTTNGLVVSQTYRLSTRQSVLPELKATLRAELNQENGYIKVSLKGELDAQGYEKTATGFFLLSRRKANETGNWEELSRFMIQGKKPSSWSWKDFTIEQGVSYVYSIQQYSDTLYSQRILSKIRFRDDKWIEAPIYADFEHAFLFDGERQLKIKYNPQISSFKTNILESKIDTLGSKHPFIFKNGHVAYKDFPISGLISYLMDEEKLFLNTDIYSFTSENLIRNSKDDLKEIDNRTTNLTSENVYRERDFKLNVLNWLNNGKPKLFRSPTEGNYIVRLMNNTLAPNATVGRMLHTFSSNAYEIADFNYDNLLKYEFINNNGNENFESRKVIQWTSIDGFKAMTELEFTNSWTSNLLKNKKALELDIIGMIPGDKIKFTYENETEEHEIIIGVTGAYKVLNIKPITSLKLHRDNAIVNSVITYSFETVYSSAFGLYYNATVKDTPAKQFFGNKVINTNIISLLDDLKTSVLNIYYINFEKRPVYTIYAEKGSDINVNNSIVNFGTLTKLFFDKNKNDRVTLNKLDPYAVYKIQLDKQDNSTDIKFNNDYYLYNENYYSKHNAFICFDSNKNRATIQNDDKFFTKIFIDPEINEYENIPEQLEKSIGIDLAEIENYYLTDYRPRQLYIGLGVIMTIGYYSSFVTYNFEENSKYESYNLKKEYDNAILTYESMLTGNVNSTPEEIENARVAVNESYNNLLKQLEEDLKDYKREFGLE